MIKLKGVNNNNLEFSALIFGHELPLAVRELGNIEADDLLEVYGDFFTSKYRGEYDVEMASVYIRANDKEINISDLIDLADLEYKVYMNLDFNQFADDLAEDEGDL